MHPVNRTLAAGTWSLRSYKTEMAATENKLISETDYVLRYFKNCLKLNNLGNKVKRPENMR